MVATLVLCGSPDPDAILAAFFNNAEADGCLHTKLKV